MTVSARRLFVSAAVIGCLALAVGLSTLPAAAAPRHQITETPRPTDTPTGTPTPTATETPTATVTPGGYARPVIVLQSYSVPGGAISPGQNFDLTFRLANPGQGTAFNVLASFEAGDFLPRGTGGVIAAGAIAAAASTGYTQPLTASEDLEGSGLGTLGLQVSYTDLLGTAYAESFTLTIPVAGPTAYIPSGGYPTRTPTAGPAPQLLILEYETEPLVLSPGTRFAVRLHVANVGGSMARRVTMIVGGGSAGGGGPTPGADPGGLSGAGGDYTHFAPVGSSNVQYLGDLPSGISFEASQALIVNSSTAAGAYPLRVSFVHYDDRGVTRTDDQVVTLLVYAVPSLDISFYRPLDPFYAGQPGLLPLQVVNIGRTSAILGEMEVTADGADLSNSSTLVGLLDPGGYFTLDAMAMPMSAGRLGLTVTLHYLDDFNQQQTVVKELSVEVLEAIPEPGFETGGQGELPMEGALPPETFWQKLWHAILGFLGLDSGRSEAAPSGVPVEMPQIYEGPPG